MTLPYSEPLEAALVARLLVDPAQLPVIAGSLAVEDFYVPIWREAYAAMQKLSVDRKTVDIENLRTHIGSDADDLAQRVGEITAGHRAPLDEYSGMVRGLAFKRRVVGQLERVIARASDVDQEVLLADLYDAVQQISEGMEEGSIVSPAQAVEIYLREMDARGRGDRRGLSWGLNAMDDAILPAMGGDMIVLMARPSVGKTALAAQVADHWAGQSPHPILFASLEMGNVALTDRAIARATGLNGRDVIRGIMTAEETAKVREALELRRGLQVWQVDDPYATTATVRAAAARIRLLAGGLSGIVVDYLQLLKDKHESEVTRVTRVSGMLKALAREFNVPVLALSQMNRAATNREDQHPRLSDLRESGAIEQDADVVLGLWRQDLQSPFADLDILKARQGVTGRVYLEYDGPHYKFIEPGERAIMQQESAADSTAEFIDRI